MNPKRTRTIIAAVSLSLTAVLAAAAAYTWVVPSVKTGEAADFETEGESLWLQDGGFAEQTLYAAAWNEMNRAMQEGDREAFLSHAKGDAVDQLARWWDNTDRIGWTTGFAQPYRDESGDTYERLLLGADLGFTQRPIRGGGSADAGKILAVSAEYEIQTEGEGDDLVITSMIPAGVPAPWDEAAMVVERGEHVVVVGTADEQQLVEATVASADEAAAIALDAATTLGAETPESGFVVAITDDPSQFSSWYVDSDEVDSARAAEGFTRLTARVAWITDLLDAEIAASVSNENAGAYVVLGPGTKDYRLNALVHEFAHVMHATAVPTRGMFQSYAAEEGFAQYVGLVGGTAGTSLVGPAVQAAVAERGANAMSNESFRSADVAVAYNVAGSYYEFVADQGGDPWELAVAARSTGTASLASLVTVGVGIDGNFSEDRWKAWVAAK